LRAAEPSFGEAIDLGALEPGGARDADTGLSTGWVARAVHDLTIQELRFPGSNAVTFVGIALPVGTALLRRRQHI